MYTTDGIVLKKIDVGEADAFFTIYTKEFGKIKALAIGIKKEGAKLKGHCEMFSFSRFSFVAGKNGERLTHATLMNFWERMRVRPDALEAAAYIAALVDTHCLPGERDKNVWNLLYESFFRLNEPYHMLGNREEFLNGVERRLVRYLGYGEEHIRVLGDRVARPAQKTV